MKRVLFFLILFMMFSVLHTKAQVLVNRSWVLYSGQPDGITLPDLDLFVGSKGLGSSLMLSPNELIVVGNTKSAGGTDILISKQNSSGQILWEQTFSGPSGGESYGLKVATDQNQHILVAGVVETNSGKTDIVLLKYTSSGTLVWSLVMDGGNDQFDVPTALMVDANNDVYLAGATLSLSTQLDWYVAKISNSGVLLWQSFYDYNGLHEFPVAMDVGVSGSIEVRGFSNSLGDVWDYVALSLSGATGVMVEEQRKTIPNLLLSEVVLLSADEAGNIYVGGTTNGLTSGDRDMLLVKLDNNLDIAWTKEIDVEGGADAGRCLVIDQEGSVVFAGNSKKLNGGTQITISKYSASGQLVLRQNYMAPVSYESAKVSGIEVNGEGDIFVTGSVQRNGAWDIVTLMYDSTGTLRMEKFFDSGGADFAEGIVSVSENAVIITGQSEVEEVVYTTIKYDFLKRTNEVVWVDGVPDHKAGELVVKFLPQYVDTGFVDDRSRRYGSIYDVLTEGAAGKISDQVDLRGALFAKAYPRLTTSHTQSLTRLGDTIPIPEFWSVFLVVVDAGQDIDDLITAFTDMPEYVVYAHPNHVYAYHTIPNDPLFQEGYQSSLFPSEEFPGGHINVEPAWDIETGQPYVKVGVFDSPILWSHEDFGDGTLEGSQIKDGFDFVNQTGIAGFTNPAYSHGTAVAGIIGALRDNGKGIAGIAGGGMDANGNFNDGVALHSMAIGVFAPDVVAAAQGIVEGAMDANAQPAGFAQNIQNYSWTGLSSDATLENAVEFAWRNQCILVASRGNGDWGSETLLFPACYTDEWILNVGGSGTWGEYNPPYNYGGGMDVIAPGVSNLVTTLINPNAPFGGDDPPLGEGNAYQQISGTSAAAPHVSGVAALMYSRHHVNQGQPNNLAPEDVEFILQRYATDIAGGFFNYPIGYDDWNGWGRVNAFEAVRRVEGPQWQVFHNSAPDNVQQTTAGNQQWLILTGVANLPSGIYYGDRVTITHTYLDVFSPATQIVDSWIRWSATDGVSAENPVSGVLWADFDFIIEGNVASVTVTTNVLHITSSASGQNLDIWYPAHPDAIRTSYSLHLFDPQATSGNDVSELGSFEIFPNPAGDNIRIYYVLTEGKANFFQLRDVTGRLLLSKTIDNEVNGELILDLSQLSEGVYLCQLHSDKGVVSRKVIKQ